MSDLIGGELIGCLPIGGDSGHGGAGNDSGGDDGGTPTPDLTRHGIRFDRRVHAVDDLGWRPDGDELIDVPEEDGLLIEVPKGDYLTGHNVFKGVERWGIVALDKGVRFLPRAGRCTRALHFSSNDPSNEILLEGLTFHQRNGLKAGLGVNATVRNKIEIHDCERTGRTPNRVTAGPPRGQEVIGLSVNVLNQNGRGRVIGWTDHCDTRVISYPGNAQGISIWQQSKGTVVIRDASIRNQGEHALYASKAAAVEVHDSTLVDNANTNIRIAGEGSFAKNCRIGYQRDASYTDHHDEPGRKATKIARIEDSRKGASGGYLEDCELFCKTDGLQSAILVHVMGNTSGFVVRDSTIRNNSDMRGVVIDPEGSGWRGIEPPDDKPIEFLNVDFEGTSANPPIDANRPGKVRMEGCSINMPNASGPRGV